jgi:acyl carrier protein
MKEFVIKIISELADIDVSKIDLTSTFKELCFDNLDIAELVMAIEDKLRITASDSMFYTKSVSELIEQIEKLNIKTQIN